MASATLVRAEWAHGKYDSYVLSRSGQFTGFVHPPGWAFKAEEDSLKPIADDTQFLSCRNIGSGLGAICASLPLPFQKMPQDEVFACDLLLHRSIHFCQESKELFHLYYKWNSCIVPYASVQQFMKAHHSLQYFLKEAFSPKLSVTPVRQMSIRFINQISGFSFLSGLIPPQVLNIKATDFISAAFLLMNGIISPSIQSRRKCSLGFNRPTVRKYRGRSIH